MLNKFVGISAKIVCLLLVLALAAGCGSSGNSSDEWIYSEIVITGDGETDGTQSGDASGTDNVSTGSNGSSSTTSGGKGGPSGSGSSGGVNPEDYRGTTVRYATWIDPKTAEDGPVVDDFTKKYGIKVQVDMVPQSTYVNEIAGMIASGNSPDVFFDNCFFPSSLSVLQPIDAMKLDLSDSIWEKGILEMSKFGGKSFLVNTVGNIWSEVDCVYYNKKIFADNNIRTPEEYYEAGKWTWAALTKCMTDVKNAGYIGGYIDMQTMLGSTGAGFYSLKNGKFANSVNDMTYNAMTQMAQWVSDGLIRPPLERNLINNFITGKAGIAVTNAFGLKETGYFKNMNQKDIGFTYLPSWDENTKAYTTGLFRGWGLCRGAKNPVGAGIFLRYYLDVNNYDYEEAFINSDAADFFLKLTTGVETDDKNPYFLLGIGALVGETDDDYKEFVGMAPGQVRTAISAKMNTFKANANKVNDEISKQLKSLGLG